MIKTLFGNRVALQMTQEEYTGLIVPASTEAKMYVLSKVLAVSDQLKPKLIPGDIVFWQSNDYTMQMRCYGVNGKQIFVLEAGDMIAKLTRRVVTREHFQVVGEWCLLRRQIHQPSKLIILPDNVIEANQAITVKFFLDAKGELADTKAEVGQEVIVERGRTSGLKLGNDTYYYLLSKDILGVV